MRNPLKRLARRDQPRIPLRDRLGAAKARLAAMKAKAATMGRVNRALLRQPVPASAQAVDRAALVNYATFLALERERVCAELYPHLGVSASRFVLSMNEAWGYFRAGDSLPPSSSRAIGILDGVGIDWRKDRDAGGVLPDLDCQRDDTGKRPPLPLGFPSPDAELLEALDDLTRLDAAIEALLKAGDEGREDRDVPCYQTLDAERDRALERLVEAHARSSEGLRAKARALQLPSVNEAYENEGAVAQSLARDLLGLPLI